MSFNLLPFTSLLQELSKSPKDVHTVLAQTLLQQVTNASQPFFQHRFHPLILIIHITFSHNPNIAIYTYPIDSPTSIPFFLNVLDQYSKSVRPKLTPLERETLHLQSGHRHPLQQQQLVQDLVFFISKSAAIPQPKAQKQTINRVFF